MAKNINVDAINQIFDEEVEFYTDELNEESVFVEYPLPSGARCFTSSSNARFQAFLSVRYCELAEEALCPPAINAFLEAREQQALYSQSKRVAVNRRVTGSIATGKIAYFLGNEKWQSVLVDKKGWHIGRLRKTKFLKSTFDEEQVSPVGGGDLLALLRPFVNLEDDSFILFVLFMVQAFSRKSSHYAAVISSGKGTGKSTLTKLFRSLVDPSASDSCLAPTNEGDLTNSLANSYVACFDNTAVLSTKSSNILCAAITGTKEAKRRLYTDSEQIVLSLHNVVVINGIDIVPRESDLADRALYFELQPISESARRTDDEILAEFNGCKAKIMGAIFETLKTAMSVLPTLQFSKLARMADAYKEMAAIAVALDIEQKEFKRIFDKNRAALQESYNMNNPFVEYVLEYLQNRPSIYMTATALYESMKRKLTGNTRFFPEGSSALSRKLNRERDALFAAGYELGRDKKADANYISIKRIPKSQQTKAQKDAAARRKSLLEDASSED